MKSHNKIYLQLTALFIGILGIVLQGIQIIFAYRNGGSITLNYMQYNELIPELILTGVFLGYLLSIFIYTAVQYWRAVSKWALQSISPNSH